MTPFDDFLPFVLPYVPGCADQVALHHLKLASVEFCSRTLVWQEELDPVTANGTATEFTLNLPEGTELVRLLEVTAGEQEYEVLTAQRAHRLTKRGRGDSCRKAWSINRQDLAMQPAPGADVEIQVLAALKPQIMTATELPDDLRQYAETIAAGARASIMLLPGEWRDLTSAQVHRTMFVDEVNTLAMQVARGFGGARIRANPTYY